ncbi:MAG: hypothetical protein QMD10_11590, partial [Desulfitobacteriaceae bacterium]|nr:hypothetical protein [Desulfitobacteriaceae bacterium]
MHSHRALMKCFILFILLCSIMPIGRASAAKPLPQTTVPDAGWISLLQFGVPDPIRLSGQFGE